MRVLGIAVIGLASAGLGWFLGPNGAVAAPMACAIALVALRTGTRSPRLGWVLYSTLAGGQALVFALVLARVLPDRSLTCVLVPGHPDLHHVFGQVFVQGTYLSSFFWGRALERRYEMLATEVDEATRQGAVREAMLDEARAAYRRALQQGKRAIAMLDRAPITATAATIRLRVGDATTPTRTEVSPGPPAIAGVESDRPSFSELPGMPPDETGPRRAQVPTDVWLSAYRYRLRGQAVILTVFCIGGAAYLVWIADSRMLLAFAIATIAATAALVWWQLALASRRIDRPIHWPWAMVAALSVGPAVCVGLHSGFTALVGATLLLGGLFRQGGRSGPRNKVWIAIALSHGGAFVLAVTGVIPEGNMSVMQAGLGAAIAQQIMLQAVFFGAHAAASAIDARYERVMEDADVASRRAAKQEAMLAAATRAIDRLLAEPIFSGQRVGGFLLDRPLGQGGMGDVYAATEIETGREAAVKLLRHDRADDPRSLELFAEEARVLGRVRSPFVAEVLAAGTADDVPFIAMERVTGRTLSSILDERTLSIAELRALARDLCRGLAHVHAAGVVHCDIKPSNIILTSEPEPRFKLIDFGVAQIQGLVSARGTTLAGTPQYMSPEQARAEPLDARSDLYSFCLVLVRAATGRPAFDGRTFEELANARARGFVDRDGRLPAAVATVLKSGLALRPDERFASARELAGAFAAAFAPPIERDAGWPEPAPLVA